MFYLKNSYINPIVIYTFIEVVFLIFIHRVVVYFTLLFFYVYVYFCSSCDIGMNKLVKLCGSGSFFMFNNDFNRLE